MTDRSYYDILGVPKDADAKKISSAYKQLAKKWHPDKNLDNQQEAAEKFKEIAEAYEILSNPEKREIYDTRGKQGLSDNGMEFNPEDFFKNLFGHVQEQAVLQIVVNMTLEEIFKGRHVEHSTERDSPCKKCNATGYADGNDHACKKCGGDGYITMVRKMGLFTQQIQMPCDGCKEDKHKKCGICDGSKLTKEKHKLVFDIPKGISMREQIVIKGEGNWIPKLKRRSDILIRIKERKHSLYQRINHNPSDLFTTIEISLAEALCGVRRKLQFLDNEFIVIKYDNVVEEGKVIVIEDKGLPYYNRQKNGKLHVQFKIKFPSDSNIKGKKQKIWQLLTGTPYQLDDFVGKPNIIIEEHEAHDSDDDKNEHVECAQQ